MIKRFDLRESAAACDPFEMSADCCYSFSSFKKEALAIAAKTSSKIEYVYRIVDDMFVSLLCLLACLISSSSFISEATKPQNALTSRIHSRVGFVISFLKTTSNPSIFPANADMETTFILKASMVYSEAYQFPAFYFQIYHIESRDISALTHSFHSLLLCSCTLLLSQT